MLGWTLQSWAALARGSPGESDYVPSQTPALEPREASSRDPALHTHTEDPSKPDQDTLEPDVGTGAGRDLCTSTGVRRSSRVTRPPDRLQVESFQGKTYTPIETACQSVAYTDNLHPVKPRGGGGIYDGRNRCPATAGCTLGQHRCTELPAMLLQHTAGSQCGTVPLQHVAAAH